MLRGARVIAGSVRAALQACRPLARPSTQSHAAPPCSPANARPSRSILFPLPIMALVPLRQYLMPRCFANRRHLQELDAAHEEEVAPLPHEQALRVSERGRGG